MKFFSILTVSLLILAFTACAKEPTEPEEPNKTPYVPIELDLKSASLVKSSNTFGANIFKEVLEAENEESNVLLSPLSIFQALSMVRNGAGGLTKDEINSVLAFDKDQQGDLNEYQQKLVKALTKADGMVDLTIANSIWYNDTKIVKEEFVKVNSNYFNAQISALDFTKGAEAKQTINNWVNDQTRGKIPDIVDEITDDHVMFLINAIYFYGQWQNKFDPKKTRNEPFFTESGEKVDAKMMMQEGVIGFKQNDLFTLLEIPYGNGHFNMVALVPQEDKSVSDIVASLTDENWEKWTNDVYKIGMLVGFPKFKFECEYKLNKGLENMGMPLAFTQHADFSNIFEEDNVYISLVKHKTFIEVDEKGTEAAATTSVEMVATSLPESLTFVVNKPFLFAITEKDTNTILFLGRLMKP